MKPESRMRRVTVGGCTHRKGLVMGVGVCFAIMSSDDAAGDSQEESFISEIGHVPSLEAYEQEGVDRRPAILCQWIVVSISARLCSGEWWGAFVKYV